MVLSFFREAYTGLFRHDLWNIGIIDSPAKMFLESSARPEVAWIQPSGPDRFFADPFGIMRDRTLHILCEEFDYRAFKGRIVSFAYADGVRVAGPDPVMEFPYHLSYPYLFEEQGEIYCIPEAYQTGEVRLYRAEDFPKKWKKVAVLVRGVAALDATVFQYDGHWWLTCSDDNADPLKKLFIWHSSDLLGHWSPHHANPVKTDIYSSRPAGTPFLHKGCLYRPAQDCSRTYGGRVVLNRIAELTETEFNEESARFIEPWVESPWPDGVHTLSAVGNFTLVDAKRLVFLKSALRQALVRRRLLREMGL